MEKQVLGPQFKIVTVLREAQQVLEVDSTQLTALPWAGEGAEYQVQVHANPANNRVYLKTPPGWLLVKQGDYILKGDDDLFYLCDAPTMKTCFRTNVQDVDISDEKL